MLKILVVSFLFCGTAAPYSRKAFGRNPQIGGLYDRRRDLILPGSLFREALPQDKIKINKKSGGGWSFFNWALTFKQRAVEMKLSKEEILSVALGIMKLEGSATYLAAALGKSQLAGRSASHDTKEAEHRIDFRDYDFNSSPPSLKKLVDREVLKSTEATDVITGVLYGYEEYLDYIEVPETGASFNDIDSGLGGNVGFNSTPSLCIADTDRSPAFVCLPDMIDQELPRLTRAQRSRKLANPLDDGIGRPIIFYIEPLSNVKKHFKNIKTLVPYLDVPSELSDRVVETVDEVLKVKNNLSGFWNRTLCQPSIIPESKLSLIKSWINSWSNNITAGVSKMAEVILAYRNGSATVETLKNIHDQLLKLLSDFSFRPVKGVVRSENRFLGQYTYAVLADDLSSYDVWPITLPKFVYNFLSVEKKVDVEFPFVSEYKKLADSLSSDGLKMIANSSILSQLVKANTTFVVLKYKLDWIQGNRAEWDQLRSIFLSTRVLGNEIGDPDKYLIDCDVLPENCANVNEIQVNNYEGGQLQNGSIFEKYTALVKRLSSSSFKLITNADTMNQLIRENKTFVALKFKMDWILENPEEWNQLDFIFSGYHKMWNWFENPDKYLLDCDLLPEHCEGVNKMVVNRYNVGQLEGAGDYLCAISKSFLGLQERNPYGAFRASWYIDGPFKEPYIPCRTRRVLAKYQGVFWEHDFEIIV